ncbi:MULTISPECIES: hypothetical protein [unclassified Paenibacillus]|uniref:hypothetical protein n=1 Tax=unclassified Paenibacillus TaxID=185978 RepID=UPI00020D72E6|nr:MULTISPECIES: hypothetical protein [unclassified Paenibacillus]EGL15611.1 hypothetical protein HMPREF9413_5178 [Paenibacillus sp. HGF7]EPD88254.1 hypothetical protein HMPREF1207_02428 [Paenibacillus sp. HGH0039]
MNKSEVREDIDRLAVAAGAFSDDDSYDIRAYVGNYSSSYTFQSSLPFTTYDAQGQVVHEKSYDNVIIIAPGEKKKLDSYYTSNTFVTYRYTFTAR